MDKVIADILAIVNRYHRLAVLGAWACAMGFVLLTPAQSAFLGPVLRVVALAGGIVLGGMLAVETCRMGERRLTALGALQVLVLLTPLLYLGLARGAVLDSYAFHKRTINPETHTSYSPGAEMPAPVASSHRGDSAGASLQVPEETPVTATLLEIARNPNRYKEKIVLVEGMVFRSDELPSGHFVLFRFVITCCAADARPIGFLVECSEASRVEKDAWVQVQGRFEIENVEGVGVTGVIRQARTTPCKRPAEPYL